MKRQAAERFTLLPFELAVTCLVAVVFDSLYNWPDWMGSTRQSYQTRINELKDR